MPALDVRRSIEENLLFGVMAFQKGMITEKQFAHAGVIWSAGFQKPLLEVLLEQKHLTDADCQSVQADNVCETIIMSLGYHMGQPTVVPTSKGYDASQTFHKLSNRHRPKSANSG